MTYTEKGFLPQFRGPGRCELCPPEGRCGEREPHHVIARGMGGADELNLPINLISLGCCWCCGHHRRYHAGQVDKWDVLEAVARREGLDPGFLESRLWKLVRAPKECDPCLRCQGAGTVKVRQLYRPLVFTRYDCPYCKGGGVLGPDGEPWVEHPRRFAGT